MNTLNTRVTRAASGVTRRNARNSGQCPRCHHYGTFAPDSIVCARCTTVRPVTLTVSLTRTVAGGER
jgi:hypothetical protein